LKAYMVAENGTAETAITKEAQSRPRQESSDAGVAFLYEAMKMVPAGAAPIRPGPAYSTCKHDKVRFRSAD
jgi:hypothetical protein